MSDFSVTLSTGDWHVVTSGIDGATCYARTIVILPKRTRGKEYAITAIHEALHASNPDWSEETVTRTAKDLAEVLWKIGYRKTT